MFVLNDYMKKNLRFIIPVAALIVLAIIFGIMYFKYYLLLKSIGFK